MSGMRHIKAAEKNLLPKKPKERERERERQREFESGLSEWESKRGKYKER